MDAIHEQPLFNDWSSQVQESISFSTTNNYIKKHYPIAFAFVFVSFLLFWFIHPQDQISQTKTETIFSETETFFRHQIFWNQNFFLFSSFSKLIQKPSEKNWQVSKPRSFDTKMSHSCRGAILSINHKFQGFWRGDANRSYRAPTLSIFWKQLPWYWPRYVIQF